LTPCRWPRRPWSGARWWPFDLTLTPAACGSSPFPPRLRRGKGGWGEVYAGTPAIRSRSVGRTLAMPCAPHGPASDPVRQRSHPVSSPNRKYGGPVDPPLGQVPGVGGEEDGLEADGRPGRHEAGQPRLEVAAEEGLFQEGDHHQGVEEPGPPGDEGARAQPGAPEGVEGEDFHQAPHRPTQDAPQHPAEPAGAPVAQGGEAPAARDHVGQGQGQEERTPDEAQALQGGAHQGPTHEVRSVQEEDEPQGNAQAGEGVGPLRCGGHQALLRRGLRASLLGPGTGVRVRPSARPGRRGPGPGPRRR